MVVEITAAMSPNVTPERNVRVKNDGDTTELLNSRPAIVSPKISME